MARWVKAMVAAGIVGTVGWAVREVQAREAQEGQGAENSLARADAAFSDAAARSGSEQAQFFERLLKYAVPAIAIIFVARSYFK